MKNTLLILIALVILNFNYSKSQTWTKVNGTESNVNSISFDSQNPNKVIVTSYEIPLDLQAQSLDFYNLNALGGIQISNDKGNSFGSFLMNLYQVLDVEQDLFNPSIFYASVVENKRAFVSKSIDGGNTWSSDELNCKGSFQFIDLLCSQKNANTFFAATANTVKGIHQTNNSFKECLFEGDINNSIREIKISKKDKNVMVAASDSKTSGGIYISTDAGNVWVKNDLGLVNHRVLSVQPSAKDVNVIFCSIDSVDSGGNIFPKGIYRTEDMGISWELWAAQGEHITDIEEHPTDVRYMIAAAGKNGVWTSGTSGKSWEKMSNGFNNQFAVQRVAIPNLAAVDGGFYAYAGTIGDGFYKSDLLKPSLVSVESENMLSEFQIYPNPSNGYLNITFNALNDTEYEIEFVDLMGNFQYADKNILNMGNNSINLDLNFLPKGTYLAKLKTKSGTNTKIIQIVK